MSIVRTPFADLPTALFISSDQQSVGVLLALHEAGVRGPEDIAIVSFDGSELGGVVSEIDKLFSQRFDALVSSLEIGKPPRGPGGSGHGGGRRPRHLH